MKKLFDVCACLSLIVWLSPAIPAAAVQPSTAAAIEIKGVFDQKNLIGEVTSIDQAGGKIVILTDAKVSVTVTFNEQTIFRRVLPGQTSLANAETIKIADLKIGDRILVPGSVASEQTPVKQIIVMPR